MLLKFLLFDFVCFLCLFDNANIQLYFICQAKNIKIFMLYVVKNQRFIKKVKIFFINTQNVPHFFTPKQRQPQNFQFPAIYILLSITIILFYFIFYILSSSVYIHFYIIVYSFTFLLLVYSSSYYYLICLLSYMFTILLFYFLMYMIVYI